MSKILIDMDGVIANWGKQYDAELDRRGDFAANIPRTKDQLVFNLNKGRTGDEQSVIAEVMNTRDFYAKLEPMPGAIDALKRMLEDGHDVRIVTSPWLTNPTCISDKFNWVAEHLGAEWLERVIITADKTHVSGDILIDDKPEITGSCEPSWVQVVFSQPYNQHVHGKWFLLNWEAFDIDQLLEDVVQPRSDKFVAGAEVRSVSRTGGEKGTKDARFDLIPIGALTALATHYGVGARKYADNQWRKGYEWSKSYAAMQRHLTAWWGGENTDEETGSSHIASAAWHCFTLLTFIDEHPDFDDRFTTEKSAA